MLAISLFLPGTQDDCRRERLRVKETNVKCKQGGQAFLLLQLMEGPSKEPMLLCKAVSKYFLYPRPVSTISLCFSASTSDTQLWLV
jgi:hypothetical protein